MWDKRERDVTKSRAAVQQPEGRQQQRELASASTDVEPAQLSVDLVSGADLM